MSLEVKKDCINSIQSFFVQLKCRACLLGFKSYLSVSGSPVAEPSDSPTTFVTGIEKAIP